jgi:plasmid segregation protein ParM
MNTSNFKTKTLNLERNNVSANNTWGIALDIGYSAVKGFSPNAVYCFPSYARKINGEMLTLGQPGPNDIQYRDEVTGEVWAVGASAQNMITSDDSKDSAQALYGRNRYFSPMFTVIARVGLALGMISNKYGSPNGKTIVVQTGLPPAYLKSDTDLIKEALSGSHDFSIKIGTKPWSRVTFDLPEENIWVMAQPMGTLLSIATDNDGKFIPESKKYFSSAMLIFDPGFGTFDVFNIRNRLIESYETFDDLGMRRVFQETADAIYKEFKTEISVPSMQKYLETGEVKTFDRKHHKTENKPFEDILNEKNKMVCMEALEKINNIYNDLFDHDYLVITGGTGAAWNDIITEYYGGMESLTIIAGNQNDSLPYIFSNVRGYYMYMVGRLKQMDKQS